MPFKANAARRHHIPKQKRKVTNWAAYDARLRRRGNLTVWFSDEAIAAWQAAPRTTRGGQAWYSPLAILTALTLKAVFRLALRQTEGLIGSIITLLGLALAVPDHSTLSRRAEKCRAAPQRFLPTHDQIANLFSRRPNQDTAANFRIVRNQAWTTWAEVTDQRCHGRVVTGVTQLTRPAAPSRRPTLDNLTVPGGG